MPDQNIEPKKNPSRNNKTVLNPNKENQNEKRFTGESNEPRRKPEINPGELDKKEIDLDSDGATGSQSSESYEFGDGESEKTEQSNMTPPSKGSSEDQIRQ